jgi:dTDP-4-dehydrorhamnose reductase
MVGSAGDGRISPSNPMEAKWCTVRILITGASGLFGSKLAELALERNFDVYSGFNQDQPAWGIPIQLDVSNKNQVQEVFRKVNPAAVVHAAALTDVDKCETNKQLAWKINVEGAESIVEAAKKSRAFLIYISTDYVFNGEKGNYKEADPTDPIDYYGFTKLKAEELVREMLDEYCIARASVLFGSAPATGKTNFVLWLLDKFKRGERAKIVTDQWNSPTLNTNMAEMTLEVVERKLTGIYHLSGATRISRFDFAALLARTFDFDTNLIVPTSSAEFSWIARRPRDSSLDTAKAHETLRTKPQQIQDAVDRLKRELVGSPR